MRHWLFHPLLFYPLAALIAVLVVGLSLNPRAWPRQPAPTAGQIVEGALVLEGEAFTAPGLSPEQHVSVARDFWGKARSLRIAVLPGQPPPTPAETGVRLLLAPQAAALMDDKPVTVEVRYNPLPFNAATGLAVSLQGIGPADWVSAPIPPQPGVVRFALPAAMAVNAIGLRAISEGQDQAYGLEILRVRVIPQSN